MNEYSTSYFAKSGGDTDAQHVLEQQCCVMQCFAFNPHSATSVAVSVVESQDTLELVAWLHLCIQSKRDPGPVFLHTPHPVFWGSFPFCSKVLSCILIRGTHCRSCQWAVCSLSRSSVLACFFVCIPDSPFFVNQAAALLYFLLAIRSHAISLVT